MSEWFQNFKLELALERQSLKRISNKKYESIDEILYDIHNYLEISYRPQLYEQKKELFYLSLCESQNLGNIKDQFKDYILDNFFENCHDINLEILEKNENYLLANGLLKEEDMSLDKDRHTLIMTNLVEIMINSIERWCDERYQDNTNRDKKFSTFKHHRNSGE